MIDFDIQQYEHCIPPRMSIENVLIISDKETNHHPYALNISGVGSLYPETKEEALKLVTLHRKKRMDVGYMQVSSGTAKRRGVKLEELLDPCINIKHGSGVFLSDFDRRIEQGYPIEQATLDALSAYNTGSFTKGYKNGYVQRYSGMPANPKNDSPKHVFSQSISLTSQPKESVTKKISLGLAVPDVPPTFAYRTIVIRNIKHIKTSE